MVSSPNVIGNIMTSRQNLSAAGKSLTSRRKLMSFIECSFLFSLFFYQVHYQYSTCVLLWRFRWFWRRAPGRRKRPHPSSQQHPSLRGVGWRLMKVVNRRCVKEACEFLNGIYYCLTHFASDRDIRLDIHSVD